MSRLSQKPTVAILGPPNVGKSTLFNLLTRSRQSLVKDKPGVTRDVLIGECDWWGKKFIIADTGGLIKNNFFSSFIEEQITSLLHTVPAFILIFDGRDQFLPEYKEVLNFIKKFNKPIYIAINKIDSLGDEQKIYDFYSLGEDIHPTSFETTSGIADIVEWIITHLPENETTQEENKDFQIAVLGKPNTGKSSFCNYLLGYKRMIVTDKPGTTVDPVREVFEFKGQKFQLVDTAGLRRLAKRREDHVELLSGIQAEKIIHQADLILYFIDTHLDPSVQDAKVIEKILETHKPVIIVGNKIDISRLEKENMALEFREKLDQTFHFIESKDLTVHLISAKTGEGIEKLFRKIKTLETKLHSRFKTSEVSLAVRENFKRLPTPSYGSRIINLYYATQTKQTPPSILIFSNYPEGLKDSHKKFLNKSLKAHFNLYGIPLKLTFLKKTKSSRSRNPSPF